MNFKSLIFSIVASSTLAACGGDVGQAIKHVGEEVNKKDAQLELAGQWHSVCDQKGILWSVAGIKSQMTVFDFYADAGKTVKLFSDDNCQTEVGQASYTGKSDVGAKTGGQESNLLTLDYNKVEMTISDDGIIKLLNFTSACGISDWVKSQKRDVTAAAGGVTCPVPKPSKVFDIAKTDGKILHFGRQDTTHNRATDEARPVELDQADGYSKQ